MSTPGRRWPIQVFDSERIVPWGRAKVTWLCRRGSQWARVAEHPEADVQHIVRGIVRRGLEPIPPKASISLRLDADVLAWFKAQGPGYQTRINAVLRAFRDASG